MKKLMIFAVVVAGCTQAQVYDQPAQMSDRVVLRSDEDEWGDDDSTGSGGGGGDTLMLCCTTWNQSENHLYRCFTVNGDCRECYEWCSNKNENGIKIKSK